MVIDTPAFQITFSGFLFGILIISSTCCCVGSTGTTLWAVRGAHGGDSETELMTWLLWRRTESRRFAFQTLGFEISLRHHRRARRRSRQLIISSCAENNGYAHDNDAATTMRLLLLTACLVQAAAFAPVRR